MVDIGDLFDRREAFGDQKLRDDLVDIERIHEGVCVRSANSFWRRSDSSCFGQDIDVPARELRREPHVLAAPADGERQLLVRNDDLDAVGVLVEHDLGDLGRRQRVDDEARRVGVPLDDVDLLALQLVDDRLHAAPRMPTQAPTGSMEESFEITAILARLPGSRATDLISTTPS